MEAIYFFSLLLTRADLSRLGRDYVSVGNYTDSYFPEHNVRFIAVNDGIDSDEGESEIAPFKNILKIRFTISAASGSMIHFFLSSGDFVYPYGGGESGSPAFPRRRCEDRIFFEISLAYISFKMCVEGKGNETIARILQEDKILNPQAYWQSKGIGRSGKKTQPNPYKWCKTTVQKILAQQEYCGDIINFKTYSKNFKNKTRLDNPPENWVIFKDVHEPIIDRATFEQVQQITAKTKRRAPKPENSQKSIFSDLLFCGDCHSKMRHHTNTRNKDIHFFVCGNNAVDYRGTCKNRHYVRADSVEQVVMLELRCMAEFLRTDEDAFADLLAQKTNKELMKDQKQAEAELQKAIVRNDTVSRLYEKLYEDNASGKVSDEWFMQLSHKYEVERLELKTKMTDLRKKLSDMGSRQQERDNFIHAIRRFMEIQKLTAPLLRELIDHIDVYETEGVGRRQTQRIVIYYRFVGYIEIPDNYFRKNYKADTRKGVSVEYIPSMLA